MKWKNIGNNGSYACIGPNKGIEFMLKVEGTVWQATVLVDGTKVGGSSVGFDTLYDGQDWCKIYGKMIICNMIKELENK